MANCIDKNKCKKETECVVNNIGNKIRDYRKAKGFSQEDLAFYCHTDKSMINKIEKGIAGNVTIFTLYKIATVLGVHLIQLL